MCENLTWVNDHYEGVRDGGNAVATTYTVARWRPDGIELHGTSKKKVDRTPFHLTGTFTGRPLPGGSVAEAKIAWRLGLKSGTNVYQLTWQPPQPSQTLAASATALPVVTPAQPQTANTTAAVIPSALIECDSAEQCARGQVGAWVFNGSKGQATWTYTAIASLTVTQFDGRRIRIHREDVPGSYSTREPNGTIRPGVWFADYDGTIEGNRISGMVSWGGGPFGGGWYAVIPQHLCSSAADCPVNTDVIMHLGAVALQMNRDPEALLCYRIGSANNNADGQGIAAGMILQGKGTVSNPAEAVPLLRASINQNSYFGMYAAAQMHAEGLGTPKNLMLAQYWKNRGDARRNYLEEQAHRRDEAALAIAAFIFAAAFQDSGGSASTSQSAPGFNPEAQQNAQRTADWLSRGGGGVGPNDPNWKMGDRIP